MKYHPIGVFDSGYGGLSILREIVKELPKHDFLYLGDNARSPYGTRSYTTVYEYTLQCVKWFFQQGCPLVILACNTASAKALRTIQQKDLPLIDPTKRVLGVIRPTAEIIGNYSRSGHVGVMGTNGTVESNSYVLEIKKFFPKIKVTQEACPMWVPLVENNESESRGADFFVDRHIQNLVKNDPDIDSILLACTHYPFLMKKILQYVPEDVAVISQGGIVAKSLAEYLTRHPEISSRCTQNQKREFFTTGDTAEFNRQATLFFGSEVHSQKLNLETQFNQ